MDWVLLIGRIVYVLLFVMSGLTFHIMGRAMAIPYARAEGAPLPELTVPLTGVVMVAAGVLTVLGIWVDLMGLIFAGLALAFAYWMHAFWKLEDPQARQMQQTHFMKNTGLAAGGIFLFYLFQQFGEEIGVVVGPPALFD